MTILEELQKLILKFVSKFKLVCIFLVIFSLPIRCHLQELAKEDKQIISLIVDKLSFPLAPPPPLKSTNTDTAEVEIDSLLNTKMVIAIYPFMRSTFDESGKNKLPEAFKKIIDMSLPTKPIKSLDGILSTKGHTIILADTVELKSRDYFEKFNLLYDFSRIWYNKNRTKAVVEVGLSRSKLNGFSTIFCFDKYNDEWSVTESIATTTW
ncbi:hypothetical protein [Allomuricauda sp. d1]|uniref:hypothetical protein n=1 Tax=Allomuricauda sp. d1 TaxID=3136725 RepID=UPI0031D86E2C